MCKMLLKEKADSPSSWLILAFYMLQRAKIKEAAKGEEKEMAEAGIWESRYQREWVSFAEGEVDVW